MKPTEYLKHVYWSEEDDCYVGTIPDLCGDCCHGDTREEVYRQLIEIQDGILELYREDGKGLPPMRNRPEAVNG